MTLEILHYKTGDKMMYGPKLDQLDTEVQSSNVFARGRGSLMWWGSVHF